jgi:HK97 family phage portal protein
MKKFIKDSLNMFEEYYKPKNTSAELAKADNGKKMSIFGPNKQIPDDQMFGDAFQVIGDNLDGRQEKMADFATLEETYVKNPFIWKAVNTICDAASKNYHIVNPVDEKEHTLNNKVTKPIYDFINRPNVDDNYSSFMFKLFHDILVFGVVFIEYKSSISNPIVANAVTKAMKAFSGINQPLDQEIQDITDNITIDGIPQLLRVIPANTMTVFFNKQGKISKYEQRINEDKQEFQPNQILHIVDRRSNDPIWGRSSISPLIKSATKYGLIEQRQIDILQSDATIDTVIVLDTANQSEVERYKKMMDISFRATGAGQRYAVVDKKVEIVDMSKSKDGDFLKERQEIKETIFSTFGIPLSVVEGAGSSQTTNADENYRVFIENTVRPMVAYVEQILNTKVLSNFQNIGLNYILNMIIEDSDDESDMEIVWTQRIINGTMNRNEYRAKLGEDSIGPDGDVYTIVAPKVGIVKLEDVINPPPPVEGAMPNPLQQDVQNEEGENANTSSKGSNKPTSASEKPMDSKTAQKSLEMIVRELKKNLND